MMYNYNLGMLGGAWWGMLMVPVLVWTLLWKGWALWVAARKGQKIWFVALLLVNTMGILEIVYIFLFSGEKFGKKKNDSALPPMTPVV